VCKVTLLPHIWHISEQRTEQYAVLLLKLVIYLRLKNYSGLFCFHDLCSCCVYIFSISILPVPGWTELRVFFVCVSVSRYLQGVLSLSFFCLDVQIGIRRNKKVFCFLSPSLLHHPYLIILGLFYKSSSLSDITIKLCFLFSLS